MMNQNEFIWEQGEDDLNDLIQGGMKYARVWEEEFPKCKAYINSLLANGDREQFSKLLSSENFKNEFSCITEMAYMILANQIYKQEVAEHVEKTILDGHTSIEEVVAYIREIRFRIWRVEFHIDENEDVRLVDYIRNNQVSSYMLKYIIHISSFDKIGILRCLSKRFLEYYMFGYAFAMLKYADELLPGTEDILCIMAELCMQAGKSDEALHCIKKIKNPTEVAEEIYRKLSEL